MYMYTNIYISTDDPDISKLRQTFSAAGMDLCVYMIVSYTQSQNYTNIYVYVYIYIYEYRYHIFMNIHIW
jgi:hypothetical protein